MFNYSNIVKKIIPTLFFVSVIIFFLNLDKLFNELKQIPFETVFLCLGIFLPHTFIYILKWYLIVKKFYKKKFLLFLKSMSKAIFLSEVTQSNLVLEFSKFYYLGNIKPKEKIILIINDKLITLIIKLFIMLLALFALFFFNKIIQYYFIYFFISLLILILFSLQFIKLFKKKLKKIYNKYFSQKIFSRKAVFTLEILRNLQFLLIYYFSFSNFFDQKIILTYIFFIPIIEVLIRFQFLSSLGSREFLLLLFGINAGIPAEQIVASSLIITVVTFSTSIINYIIVNLLIKSDGNNFNKIKISKESSKKTLIYSENNRAGGALDIISQFKYYNKKLNQFIFYRDLNLKYKNIIIIDNFINPYFFFKTLFFLKYYNGKKFMVCTEFITKKNNHVTFNYFDKNKPPRSLLTNILLFIFYKFIFLLKKNDHKNNERLIDLRFLIYYKLRFLAFKSLGKYIDKFIIVHKDINLKIINISKNKIIELPFYIDIKKLKKTYKKKISYTFSGFLTNYRYKVLKSLVKTKNQKFLNFNLNSKKINKFINSKSDNKFMKIHLYIEKHKYWPYSSPIGYINLIHKGNLAMVFRSFYDEYANNLAINSSLLNKKTNKIKEAIESKISQIIRLNNKTNKQMNLFFSHFVNKS